MDRTDLFALARAHGWTPGSRPLAVQRDAIATDIRGALTSAELKTAFGNPTRDEAVGALLEELS